MEKSELDKVPKSIWIPKWVKDKIGEGKKVGQSWGEYLIELYEK
jgi:hypothetical protein